MPESPALWLVTATVQANPRWREPVMAVLAASALLTVGFVPPAPAQDAPPSSDKPRNYSPHPEKTFPNRVYFGDAHLHTSYSTDAGMGGNT
jgi:hypothetical protein